MKPGIWIKYSYYLMLYTLFLLVAFPLFYFVYKFGDPEPLAHDFFQYYYLYKDFDVSHVIAPHNMRLAGPFFVNLLYKMNVFYDTACAFDKYASWGFLKQVYFDALLFNFFCVAATCAVVFCILKKQFHDILLSFIGALLYLLGFGTMFYELMPLTDSFSVLLFAVVFYLYLEKNYMIIIPLAVIIFQREYILIALGTLAFMDLIYTKRKYYLHLVLICVSFFVIYFVLRKTLFYTPHLDFQASGHFFLNSLFKMNFPVWQYLKQTAMTLNLFWIYLGVIFYKSLMSIPINKFDLLKNIVLFAQINLICHVAGHGTNCGRYFYLVVPFTIYVLIKEVFPLIENKEKILLT